MSCKYSKVCKSYDKKCIVCGKDRGDYYGRDRKAGCYRDIEENGNKSRYYKFSLIILSILALSFIVSAITITQITPTGNITTSNSSIQIEYNFTTDNLVNLTWNWDNSAYTLYDDSLVLFMNFDNRSSLGENDTHVVDLSKYGNNGTVVGGENITWTPNGKYGGAFEFSGNVNYINVSSLNINGNKGTTCLWIYPLISGGTAGLVSNRHSSRDTNWTQIVYRFGDTPDRVQFIIKNDTTEINYIMDTYFYSNNWYHICVSYNQSDINLYINGILDQNHSNLNLLPLSNTLNYYVGSYYDLSKSRSYNGSIDDVMIFNKSFNSNEILQLYKSQLIKFNSENWTFITNQSLDYNKTIINSSSTSKNNDCYLCSSNLTAEICSSQNSITQNIQTSNLKANFTILHKVLSSKGVYGTSISSCYWGNKSYDDEGIPCKLDTDNNGLLDTHVNKELILDRLYEMNNGWVRESWSFVPEYKNTTDSSGVNFTGDYSDVLALMKSAYERGFNVMLQIKEIPSFNIMNASTGDKDSCSGSSDQSDCIPYNYTIHANIINDAVMRVTNNGEYLDNLYIEVNNEPQFNWNKTIWVEWFNNITSYVHSINRDIKIGGGACSLFSSDYRSYCNYTLRNMKDNNFYSYHEYPLSGYLSSGIANSFTESTDFIMQNCISANCSHIIMSEGNVHNSMNRDSSRTNEYGANIATAYHNLLSYSNSSIILDYILYQFTEEYSYTNNSANYPDYNEKWHMLLDSRFNSDDAGEITIPYNVTKSFATYCPAGSTVYSSSSDDDTIKTVSCKDGNNKNIIVINTDTVSKNVSINVTGTGITELIDSNTNRFSVSDNIAQIGIMDSYDIKYLTYEPNFGSGGGSSTNPTCNSQFSCSDWTLCKDNFQTRTCIDLYGCQSNKMNLQSCNFLSDINNRLSLLLNSGCINLNTLDAIINKWKTNQGVTFSELDTSLNKFKTHTNC